MADKRDDEKNRLSNQVSAETGQFDARFMLWRAFCQQNNVPVETLPSELKGEIKDRWEKMKDGNLQKPAEDIK